MSEPVKRHPEARHELTIERIFTAPVDLVFRMWRTPEHAVRWMGPRDYPATRYEQDFRVGGAWRGCLTGAADSEHPGSELWQGGRYLEIEPPSKIAFTFAWDDGPETVCTVTFTDLGDARTRMVFHQTPFDDEANRDGHVDGWNSCFDRLEDVLNAQS